MAAPNIMAQYRPAHEVSTIKETGRNTGSVRYAEINRTLNTSELEAAYEAARDAGLWRFD